MRKFLALLLALALSAPNVHAQETQQTAVDEGCDSYADVPVNITPVFDDVGYDFSADLAQVQAIAADGANTIPRREAVVLGVTHYHPIIEFHAAMVKKQMNSGLFCAKVKGIDARIGYTDIVVYIAHEFPQGSCDFDHVMTHEQKHVAVNRDLLQEFVPLIETRLKDYLRVYGMFQVEQPDYADKLLKEKVNAIFEEMSQKMTVENQRRQKLVDTPEEYAKNNTACNGDVARIAREFVMNRR